MDGGAEKRRGHDSRTSVGVRFGSMNQLRVSVATYDQLIFPHTESGIPMLVLERKATILQDGNVNVRA
jgi:hypothetical protein